MTIKSFGAMQTWDGSPIDFIYCICKKNILSPNKKIFRGHYAPSQWVYVTPLAHVRTLEALASNGAFKPADLPLS
jgi:hypothetical protein